MLTKGSLPQVCRIKGSLCFHSCVFAMIISQLFNIANLFVLPFWALMILLPNWGMTRKVMESYLPFVALAGVYIYLFANSLDPETAQSFANSQLSDLARLF